jgi:hypothetical protein
LSLLGRFHHGLGIWKACKWLTCLTTSWRVPYQPQLVAWIFFQSGSQFKCHDFWGFHIEPDSVRTSQNKACFNLKYSYICACHDDLHWFVFQCPHRQHPTRDCTIGGTAKPGFIKQLIRTIEGGIPYTCSWTKPHSIGNFGTISKQPSQQVRFHQFWLRSISTLSLSNVSFNKLQGRILVGHQFTTFTNKSYLPENHGLCGDVINQPCSSQIGSPPTNWKLSQSRFFGDAASWIMGFWIGTLVGFCSFLVKFCAWTPTNV